MPTLSVGQTVLIVLGAVLLAAGVYVLKWRSAAGMGPRPLPVSEPTRLTLAVVMLAVGYHLVMWGLPAPWASAAAVPARLWFVVAGVALVAVLAAFILDRSERQ